MIDSTQTTETTVTATFSNGTASRTISFDRARYESNGATPNYEAMIEEEHAAWLVWLGEP
jgi:hypothetical protein